VCVYIQNPNDIGKLFKGIVTIDSIVWQQSISSISRSGVKITKRRFKIILLHLVLLLQINLGDAAKVASHNSMTALRAFLIGNQTRISRTVSSNWDSSISTSIASVGGKLEQVLQNASVVLNLIDDGSSFCLCGIHCLILQTKWEEAFFGSDNGRELV
jgi:hypothetical protein